MLERGTRGRNKVRWEAGRIAFILVLHVELDDPTSGGCMGGAEMSRVALTWLLGG